MEEKTNFGGRVARLMLYIYCPLDVHTIRAMHIFFSYPGKLTISRAAAENRHCCRAKPPQTKKVIQLKVSTVLAPENSTNAAAAAAALPNCRFLMMTMMMMTVCCVHILEKHIYIELNGFVSWVLYPSVEYSSRCGALLFYAALSNPITFGVMMSARGCGLFVCFSTASCDVFFWIRCEENRRTYEWCFIQFLVIIKQHWTNTEQRVAIMHARLD